MAGIKLAYIYKDEIVKQPSVEEIQNYCIDDNIAPLKGQCFQLITVEEATEEFEHKNIIGLFSGKEIENNDYLVVLDNGPKDEDSAAKVISFHSSYIVYNKENPQYFKIKSPVNEITFALSPKAKIMYNDYMKKC